MTDMGVTMVLEETLIFHNDTDADPYIRFLKKKGCRMVRKVESSVHEETVVRGSIRDLIEMLEGVVAADPEVYGESLPEAEYGQIMSLLMRISTEGMTHDLEIPLILSNVRETWQFVTEAMARFSLGEMIPDDHLPADFNEVLLKCRMEDQIPLEEMSKLNHTLAAINNILIMEKNGLLERGPAGCTLVKRMDPGDLLVEYRVVDPAPFTADQLMEHHLTLPMEVTLDTSIRVSTDSSLYLTSTFDEIDAVLADLMLDLDSFEDLCWNFKYKSYAVEQILDLIAEEGKVSLADIIRQMASLQMGWVEDDDDLLEPTILTLSPAFITALVGDLRKAAVIEGNDQKIRIAS
jgi:hypothetical protein